jgi:hypothetical protein
LRQTCHNGENPSLWGGPWAASGRFGYPCSRQGREGPPVAVSVAPQRRADGDPAGAGVP